MENNFIQMAASAGHAVAYTIGPIFKHIIDCVHWLKRQLSLTCRRKTYFWRHPTNDSPMVSNLSSEVTKRNQLSWCRFCQKKIFSDEAHFDLVWYENKQNYRIWGTENPHAYIEKPTHPKRVTVWCGFWSRGIIGPFFFENEQGEAVTVNGDRYLAMLNEFLFTKIEEEDIGIIWFQQDGTTCHTAEATLDVLRPVFEDRIISRRVDVVWLSRTWDFTP